MWITASQLEFDRCNSTRTLEWERVFVRGRRPSRRYGHSMVPLVAPSRTCGYAKLLLFGGTSGKNCFSCNSDVGRTLRLGSLTESTRFLSREDFFLKAKVWCFNRAGNCVSFLQAWCVHQFILASTHIVFALLCCGWCARSCRGQRYVHFERFAREDRWPIRNLG